jgi:hypothetical protein
MSHPDTASARRLPRALLALVEFFRLEAAGGITLIAAAALALIAANSPLQDSYEAFRSFNLKVRFRRCAIAKPLLLWINDGLMAVFFLLVALENQTRTSHWPAGGAGAADPAAGLCHCRRGRARRCCSPRSTRRCSGHARLGGAGTRPTSPSRWACWRCWVRACRSA